MPPFVGIRRQWDCDSAVQGPLGSGLARNGATIMLKQGIHPKIVQERLGHAKISTTLDRYSHVAPGLQEAAALRFEEGLMATGWRELVPDGLKLA